MQKIKSIYAPEPRSGTTSLQRPIGLTREIYDGGAQQGNKSLNARAPQEQQDITRWDHAFMSVPPNAYLDDHFGMDITTSDETWMTWLDDSRCRGQTIYLVEEYVYKKHSVSNTTSPSEMIKLTDVGSNWPASKSEKTSSRTRSILGSMKGTIWKRITARRLQANSLGGPWAYAPTLNWFRSSSDTLFKNKGFWPRLLLY